MPDEVTTSTHTAGAARGALRGSGAHWVVGAVRCEECGYDLRGLPPTAACPECGHVSRRAAAPAASARQRPDLAWQRSVAAGLVLMLFVTVYATSSVLVQPFTDEVAGTLPALNMPGPKLWAVPLLQRPIGARPEWPGMIGTRSALVSLLAVWLLTAPRPEGEGDGDDGSDEGRGLATGSGRGEWLRPAARWASLVLFGAAFGTLLASQGLWPTELPPYRLILVGAVELPAAALLYAYFRELAGRVPGRDRRRLFDLLRWLVPAVMTSAAALMAADWLRDDAPGSFFRHHGNRFALAVGFGILAVTAGMVATAAVGSLALTFVAAAFPEAWRLFSGVRRFGRASWRWLSAADGLRVRFACVAAGLVLIVFVAVVGNDRILWYRSRAGVGGNLPFFNFPGPKLFAAAAVPELGREAWWDPILSRTTLVALNLAAFWLVTVKLDRREGAVLRALVRWLPVLLLGAALGVAGAYPDGTDVRYFNWGHPLGRALRSEFFAAVTVACELPATVLLYAYLARLAGLYAPGRSLRRQFAAAAVAIPVLVMVSLAAFALSPPYRVARASPAVLAAGGGFGALTLAAAVWAAALMLALAGALVRRRVVGASPRRGVRPVFRELPVAQGGVTNGDD